MTTEEELEALRAVVRRLGTFVACGDSLSEHIVRPGRYGIRPSPDELVAVRNAVG